MSAGAPGRRLITGKTRLVSVLANPIHHFTGTAVQNDLAGLGVIAVPLHVRSHALANALQMLRDMSNVAGFTVTMPHKTAILDLLDDCTPQARMVGTVNVMRRDLDGRLTGHSLDGAGFVEGALSWYRSARVRRRSLRRWWRKP